MHSGTHPRERWIRSRGRFRSCAFVKLLWLIGRNLSHWRTHRRERRERPSTWIPTLSQEEEWLRIKVAWDDRETRGRVWVLECKHRCVILSGNQSTLRRFNVAVLIGYLDYPVMALRHVHPGGWQEIALAHIETEATLISPWGITKNARFRKDCA